MRKLVAPIKMQTSDVELDSTFKEGGGGGSTSTSSINLAAKLVRMIMVTYSWIYQTDWSS